MVDELLDDLNANQREAVVTTSGPLLLLAGAGSGKTRVLTRRLAYLVREELAKPEKILAVTFTNKAAKEMRDRVHVLLEKQGEKKSGAWVITFHALCVRILKQDGDLIGIPNTWSIVDSEDSRALIRQVLRERSDNDEAPEARDVREAQQRISRYKNAHKKIQQITEPEIAAVWQAYEGKLAEVQGLDFDDLLTKTVEVLETPEGKAKWCQKWDYILIDEVQDVNHVQDRIATLLAIYTRNLCVVGDDQQSVYSFRGAEVEHIMEFQERWRDAKVIKLEQNYRSTPEILEAANAVIKHNRVRLDKILRPVRKKGSPVTLRSCPTMWDEAEAIGEDIEKEKLDPESVAIVYRTNAQSRAFEEILSRRGIPYHVVGGIEFLGRAEIKTARAYLQLVLHPRDRLAFRRAIENPRRGVGPAAQTALFAFASENKLNLLQAALQAQEITGVSTKARAALVSFAETYKEIADDGDKGISLQEVMKTLLSKGGYIASLRRNKDEDALGNIGELISLLASYDSSSDPKKLTSDNIGWIENAKEFLEYAALGDVSAETREGVALMTMHATKGLEFPRVYLVGLEEALFFRGDINSKVIEEGRRLIYVGMTRAQEKLIMSHCIERTQWGRSEQGRALRFLKDLPVNVNQVELKEHSNSRSYKKPFLKRRYNSFDGDKNSHSKKRDQAQQRPQNKRSTNTGANIIPQKKRIVAKTPPTGIKRGSTIEHAKFGKGFVSQIDGDKITVHFSDKKRVLDTRYAPLKVL